MLKKIVIGLISGLISGLFATGGGLILLPALVYLFNLGESKARGTTIFCMMPMVLASGVFYYANNYIDWNLGIKCAIGGIIGGAIGSKLLKIVPEKYLKLSFIIFLAYVSIKMIK